MTLTLPDEWEDGVIGVIERSVRVQCKDLI